MDAVEYAFSLDAPQTQGATLIVRGYAETSKAPEVSYAEQTVQVLSPKAELIEKMIALAYANSKDSRYMFAPAETDYDIGVCKNFVMRLFDTFSAGYRMLAYPDLALHMPKNNSKKACAPYDYGIEWKPETAAEGSPFEIAAQFKYDDSLTEEEAPYLPVSMRGVPRANIEFLPIRGRVVFRLHELPGAQAQAGWSPLLRGHL